MPNPPKPIEQKRRLGNPGRRPLPKAGSLALVPSAQTEAWDLDPEAALERVLDAGVVWLAATDIKISLLRATLEELQAARSNGTIRDRLECIKTASSLMSELGFDPAARSRLGLAEVKAKSVLAELRAMDAET